MYFVKKPLFFSFSSNFLFKITIIIQVQTPHAACDYFLNISLLICSSAFNCMCVLSVCNKIIFLMSISTYVTNSFEISDVGRELVFFHFHFFEYNEKVTLFKNYFKLILIFFSILEKNWYVELCYCFNFFGLFFFY